MYKVVFHNQGKVYELYAGKVASSDLYGFIEVGELMFDVDEGVVVDPTEEKLRREFGDTETLYLPMHGVLWVEKVKRRGQSVIRERSSGEKVTPFPADGGRRNK